MQESDTQQEVFQKYQALVPFLVQKMTAPFSLNKEDKEDLIANAYLVLWLISAKYKQEESFKTYVYIRLKGTILDGLRQKKKHLDLAAHLGDAIKASIINYGVEFTEKQNDHQSKFLNCLEAKEIINKTINKLSQKEHIIIAEYYLKGRCFSDISRLYPELTRSWISKLHKRALEKLRFAYEELSSHTY